MSCGNCCNNPIAFIRKNCAALIAALAAIPVLEEQIETMQTQITDLEARVEALENP